MLAVVHALDLTGHQTSRPAAISPASMLVLQPGRPPRQRRNSSAPPAVSSRRNHHVRAVDSAYESLCDHKVIAEKESTEGPGEVSRGVAMGSGTPDCLAWRDPSFGRVRQRRHTLRHSSVPNPVDVTGARNGRPGLSRLVRCLTVTALSLSV